MTDKGSHQIRWGGPNILHKGPQTNRKDRWGIPLDMMVWSEYIE